jgi:hypothetical protein
VPAADSEPACNLVLVHSEGWQDISGFETIKAIIEDAAPDIEVFIASNDIRSSLTRKRAATRPTLVFSPIRLLAFRPDRGKIYQGQPMSKLKEMQRLAAAGLPVPKFEEIRPGAVLSVEDFGPFVVVKPSDAFASWGQGIELRRTREVQYRAPDDFPEGHPGRKAPMVAQKFINCGKAMTCRVLTLFGATLLTYCRQSTRDLALDPAKAVYEPSDFMPPRPIGSPTSPAIPTFSRSPPRPIGPCLKRRSKPATFFATPTGPCTSWRSTRAGEPGCFRAPTRAAIARRWASRTSPRSSMRSRYARAN